MQYDAIIIGSRMAGAATSMLLARNGYRVLVVDRSTFPSDTISTHIVWQHGVNRLMEWGLGDTLTALRAPAMDTMTLDLGAFALTGKIPAVGLARYAYAPRRTKLDPMLMDAAMEAGAELREGFSVEELLFENDRVVGIRGRDKSGRSVVERAACVVGADGRYSTVARTVRPTEYNARPALACWYYSYWSGLPQNGLRLFSRPYSTFGAVPTNDGLTCVAVAWPHAHFKSIKTDIEHHYLSALHAAPEFREEVLGARREERFYGTADLPNYFRKPYGSGWALVGDAGYHRDPILAQGISDALRDASLLAQALGRAFSGQASWNEAMASYEAKRNTAVREIYELNAGFASLEPPPTGVQMMMAALQGNAEDTSRFFGTMTGAVPVSEVYAPGNMARIIEMDRYRSHAVNAKVA